MSLVYSIDFVWLIHKYIILIDERGKKLLWGVLEMTER